MALKILMCKPSFYDIEYEINPWMNARIKVEQLQAAVQWKQLYDFLKNSDVEILTIEPEYELPDMVFTATAGLVRDNKVFLSQHRHSQRRKERHFLKQWFIKAGYELLDIMAETTDYCFEGASDAITVGSTLYAGFGIRSDRGYYVNTELFFEGDIIFCELVNPSFYHLNLCFNPLDGEVGIWYPEAFTYTSQSEMHRSMDLIAIPMQEAKRFACQAIVIEKEALLPLGCPETEKILKKLGFKVHLFNMSEFLKAGSACADLILQI